MKFSTVDAFKNLSAEDGSFLTLDAMQLKALQRCLLGIMDDIIDVCQRHGITCLMGGGTALGAIRHQGFIPWDDDIDLEMTRADYARFIPLFLTEMGDKYWVHTPERTPDHSILLARIRKKNTVVRTREDFFTDECGAFVDLFVLENVFDSPFLRGLHGAGNMLLGAILSCRRFFRDRKYLIPLTKENPQLKKTFRLKILIGFCFAFFTTTRWTRIAAWCAALCRKNSSKMVTLPAGRMHYWGEMFPREVRCTPRKASFEGRDRAVAAGVETVLVALYGDYMRIPPEDKRERHVLFAFDIGER